MNLTIDDLRETGTFLEFKKEGEAVLVGKSILLFFLEGLYVETVSIASADLVKKAIGSGSTAGFESSQGDLLQYLLDQLSALSRKD